jgi:osmoprotectant transport system permease protein
MCEVKNAVTHISLRLLMRDIVQLVVNRHDFFIDLTLQHIALSALAASIAAVIGLLLGVLISERRSLSPCVLATTNFIYTIPSISMLGFLLPFSGIGNTTAVLALAIYALLPMVRSSYVGLTGISQEVLDVAAAMGSTRWQILYKIKLPLAAPSIMAGLRNMLVMTIALAGVASFIGAGGLGVAIYRGITTNNQAMTIAGSLGIALLAIAADTVAGWLERLICRRKNMARL